MSLLNLESVTKRFGDVLAVDNITFSITDGEFVSILGPSGSGKSTILRMVAGFEKPTNGDIKIENEDVVDLPPFERDTNMVFQDLALFPHMSVWDNISYGLENKDVSSEDQIDLIEEALDMIQLGGYGDRNPEQLSGGEQQRVALARAIVNEPAIVLFDEPLASLDRQLRQHMQVELQRIQAQTDTTFLYVTHDQEVAMSISDRLILLRDGEIEQIGTAEELYEKPASQFVADFIGDVNILEGAVESKKSGEIKIRLDEINFDFHSKISDEIQDSEITVGDPIDVGIRPHNIGIYNNRSHSDFDVSGQIRNRIYQGSNVRYLVDTKLGRLTVDTDSDEYSIDEEVWLDWSKEKTHIFHGRKEMELDKSQATTITN